MTQPPRDDASLLDIARAAGRIIGFTEDLNHDTFLADVEKQSAVLYQIVILGEATKRLSADFRAAHLNVPWRQIAGLRDRVTHGYDTVDLELVWLIASTEVPDLLAAITPLLPVDPFPSEDRTGAG